MFTTTRFDSWDLPDEIQSSLKAIGWEFATQVQRDTIPLARNGTDVIGQARTGSGKTAAFGLPILERCQATGSLQALVLAPTRELANQVAEELTMLQGEAGLTILTVYGVTSEEFAPVCVIVDKLDKIGAEACQKMLVEVRQIIC